MNDCHSRFSIWNRYRKYDEKRQRCVPQAREDSKLKRTDRNGHPSIRRLLYGEVHLFFRGCNVCIALGDQRVRLFWRSPHYSKWVWTQIVPRAVYRNESRRLSLKFRRPSPQRVKVGKTRSEQISSGLPLSADITRCRRHVSQGPAADAGHVSNRHHAAERAFQATLRHKA